MSGADGTVRIGILGAARIAPMALVRPARRVPDVSVTAVAARDPQKAAAFASKHGIGKVHDGYRELIDDPDIDAVYVPLPNALHFEWTMAAIEAGKHVLCEKPFTSNATEAATVAQSVSGTDLIVMEAFHYRYHPLMKRMIEIVDSGELGAIRRIETYLCIPYPKKGDIRYRLDLSGGSTMDVGAYAIHSLRSLAGTEPTVVSARAKLSSPGVDRWMEAEFTLEGAKLGGSCTGRITCALFSAGLVRTGARVIGDKGEMRVLNTTAPHIYHRLSVRGAGGRRTERCGKGTGSTYRHQLQAFAGAVLRSEPILTPPSDSVANMTVIDAVYEASGLGRRPSRQVEEGSVG